MGMFTIPALRNGMHPRCWVGKKRLPKTTCMLQLMITCRKYRDGSRDSVSRAFTYQVQENTQDDIRNRPLVPANRLNTYRLSPLHQHIQHLRLYYKGQHTLGKGELSTILGLQQNNRREYNHPTAPQQAGLYVSLQTLNYELKYSLPEWLGHAVYFWHQWYVPAKQKQRRNRFPDTGSPTI